jgi:hypothetical protein
MTTIRRIIVGCLLTVVSVLLIGACAVGSTPSGVIVRGDTPTSVGQASVGSLATTPEDSTAESNTLDQPGSTLGQAGPADTAIGTSVPKTSVAKKSTLPTVKGGATPSGATKQTTTPAETTKASPVTSTPTSAKSSAVTTGVTSTRTTIATSTETSAATTPGVSPPNSSDSVATSPPDRCSDRTGCYVPPPPCIDPRAGSKPSCSTLPTIDDPTISIVYPRTSIVAVPFPSIETSPGRAAPTTTSTTAYP